MSSDTMNDVQRQRKEYLQCKREAFARRLGKHSIEINNGKSEGEEGPGIRSDIINRGFKLGNVAERPVEFQWPRMIWDSSEDDTSDEDTSGEDTSGDDTSDDESYEPAIVLPIDGEDEGEDTSVETNNGEREINVNEPEHVDNGIEVNDDEPGREGDIAVVTLNDAERDNDAGNLGSDIETVNSDSESESTLDHALTCLICTEFKPDNEFAILVTEACEHPEQACLTCLRAWIDERIRDGTSKIGCPMCPQLMQESDVQRNAAPNDYQQYLDMQFRSLLAADPDFVYCPNPTCESGQIQEHRDNQPIFRCNTCEAKYCLAHDVPASHDQDETCKQYEQRKQRETRKRKAAERKEDMSNKAVKRIAKECPGCGAMIQKSGGCSHMTCSRCKYQFCYNCRADYGPIRIHGNDHHAKDCRFHTANVH